VNLQKSTPVGVVVKGRRCQGRCFLDELNTSPGLWSEREKRIQKGDERGEDDEAGPGKPRGVRERKGLGCSFTRPKSTM